MKIVAYPYVDFLSSPIGNILIRATKEHICEIEITSKEIAINTHASSITDEAKKQLIAYFEGKLKQFSLPVYTEGTAFQKKIWKALESIEYGNTITYLQLAKQLQNIESVRAVANAISKNKLAIVIPCHRVIGTDGNLTGYAWGLKNKQWLINFEGNISGHLLSLF
ncbi:MAG: methylated-DNA--[protein]-cysteine S-methyltransferase [Bacteroidia bacterium]|nr:methylated-DNA--[protein]-cysteine S-methyltransferase [Bacteroidia bacterium]MCZ2140792.1 methylated-DNA--[protein]-cysteine S-methyltransferase [Bacteroidia bacterium]